MPTCFREKGGAKKTVQFLLEDRRFRKKQLTFGDMTKSSSKWLCAFTWDVL